MHTRLFPAVILLILFSGCVFPPLPDSGGISPFPDVSPKPAKWLMMVYMDSDNNLEPNSIFDIDKLESAGSTDEVIIVVQWDRNPGYETSNGDWAGTKRFIIRKGVEDWVVESEELMDLGELDMGNPDTLSGFISWAVEKYPAEKYLLEVWDHGGGWGPHTQDETSQSEMSVSGLASALEKSGFNPENKADLLVLNQCLMGQIDVAYALSPYAKAMVASEEIVPGPGIEYSGPLSELVKNPGMDERELAALLVEHYEKFYTDVFPQPFTTIAAYDLSKMEGVSSAMENLISALEKNIEENWPAIGRSVYFSEAFAKYGGMATIKSLSSYDLVDFAGLAAKELADNDTKQASAELASAIDELVISEYHAREHPFANGLSFYFPEDEVLYNGEYPSASAFASDSGWDAFLRKYILAEKTDTIPPSLEISGVSSPTTNMGSPLNLKGTATGNNLVSLYRVIGMEKGGVTYFLNNHPLTQSYVDYEGERKLPEFFDGENSIDFTWAPMAETLTNGIDTVIAPFYPAGSSDYYFATNGEYSSPSGAPFEARLIFDYRTGQLLQATRIDYLGEQAIPSDFSPEKGGIYTPYIEFYNNTTGEFGITKADSITFGNNGVWTDLALLPEGQYVLGILVGDISGNSAAQFADVSVKGQPSPDQTLSIEGITGNWQGEELGFRIMDDGNCMSIVGQKQNPCVYWFRNNNGLPLITFLISAGSPDPVFVVFMARATEHKLVLTEMIQGAKYVLWKDGVKVEAEEEKEPEPAPEQEAETIIVPASSNPLVGSWYNSTFNEIAVLNADNTYYSYVGGALVMAGTYGVSGNTFMLNSVLGTFFYTYSISGNVLTLRDNFYGTITIYTRVA